MKSSDRSGLDIRTSDQVVTAEHQLGQLSEEFPASARERIHQSPLFMPPSVMRRIIFFNELYKLIVSVPGALIQFGVRYGRDLAILSSLRALYEPLDHNRKIVGFDTFRGFPSVDARDGNFALAAVGELATPDHYDHFLREALAEHERMSPGHHLRRFETVVGDAAETLEAYLERNPHTIVAMAYFDMDVYEPTRRCLEMIGPHLTKGSVLVFDELNCAEWPGETLAVREVLGLGAFALRRFPGISPSMASFLVFE